MTEIPRDRLATLLARAAGPGRFSAARSAPADGLRLHVRGVGQLQVPVPREQAGQLCRIARPARYGRGEQTLLDRQVRDTLEIPKSRVKIDKRRWENTLRPVLDRLRADLGLPAGSELEAELHSMLVYAPGQFFVPHQDSEKHDAMVGSLVVTLPGSFTGGVLEVEHRDQRVSYRGSKSALSFVAFYADCRHQVKPVRSGHRIVLTYNLLLRTEADGSGLGVDPDSGLVVDLARCLDSHFAAAGAPNRLVYMLDHEYTARGLGWSRLKGADAVRAAHIQAAAECADCEVVLGLVDIQETWNAFEDEGWNPWYGRSRYRSWQEWDDLEDEEADSLRGDIGADDYELNELIECLVTLDSWVTSPGGQAEKVSLPLPADEICATTPTRDMQPYASEYEGYMGNYGNTLDRWYHRGAVLVWPRSRAFAVLAEASPSWALDALTTQVRRGDLTSAREAAVTLAPFWDSAAVRVEARGLFAKALRTSALLDDPAMASTLLGPFKVEMLAPNHSSSFRALVERYGKMWARALVASWSGRHRWYMSGDQTAEAWTASLPRLCSRLDDAGGAGTQAAQLLLEDAWGWLSTAMQQCLALPSPSQRQLSLSELARPVAGVLKAASVVGAFDLGDKAVELLCRGDHDLIDAAIQVLRAATASHWRSADIDRVAAYCAAALEVRVAQPQRDEDDWSIDPPGGCSCELCKRLVTFLADPAQKIFEWPLAKDGRAHLHRRIDTAELPIRHQTRRAGRPYTLVLTKTEALFGLEEQARHRDHANLVWLKSAGADSKSCNGSSTGSPEADPNRAARASSRSSRKPSSALRRGSRRNRPSSGADHP